MCDTFYADKDACSGNLSWFAKNSDRDPSEPQALCLVGRRPLTPSVKVGGRELSFPDRGYSFLLSKPSWMAGGEMGINELGVAIGNEAVFSRFPAARDGVLGMDILRAALSSSENAKDATLSICRFTEFADQGGNGSYNGVLRYCNSYIVADRHEAYVVETAGRRWAWRTVDGIAAISNAYSIDKDYRRLDAQTRKEIAPVNERAACSDEADAGRKGEKASWRAWVEDPFRLRFTKGDARRATVLSALASPKGSVRMETVLGALRSHGAFDPARPPARHMTSVCMHAGGLLSTATTASLAVAYHPSPDFRRLAAIWFTGTSYPCLSVYKPVLLLGDEFVPLWTDYEYAEGAEKSYEYWERQRAWIRKARARAFSRDTAFVAKRDAIQAKLTRAAAKALGGGSVDEARNSVNAAVREWDERVVGGARQGRR